MAVGDIPTIPRDKYPRMKKLIRRVRDGDLALDDFKTNLLSTLGRVRVDASGITASGDFGAFVLDDIGLKAILDTIRSAVDAWPLIEGQELLLKKTDGTVTRLKLGLLMKKTPATSADLANKSLPMVELMEGERSASDDGMLALLNFLFPEGLDASMEPSQRFKIHRIEEIMGWFGEGWENFSKVMGISIPALPLTQKFRLDRLGESMPAFWDSVLTKCGV